MFKIWKWEKSIKKVTVFQNLLVNRQIHPKGLKQQNDQLLGSRSTRKLVDIHNRLCCRRRLTLKCTSTTNRVLWWISCNSIFTTQLSAAHSLFNFCGMFDAAKILPLGFPLPSDIARLRSLTWVLKTRKLEKRSLILRKFWSILNKHVEIEIREGPEGGKGHLETCCAALNIRIFLSSYVS